MENKFDFFKRVTEYSGYTQYVYYNVSKNEKKRKYKAVTLESGERLRQNLITNELSNYTLTDRYNSIRNSIRRTQDQVYALCDANNFEWFITLTFDPTKIDRTDSALTVSCYEKWIMNLQHKCHDMKYLTVPELHKNHYGGKCIHFHILMKDVPIKLLGLTNSHKVCCSWATKSNGYCSEGYFNKTKHKYVTVLSDGTKVLPKPTDGIPVYNVASFIYGFTTATRIVDKARTSNYVRTYLEKGFISMSDTLYVKRYYYSRNLEFPNNWKELINETTEPVNSMDYAMNHDFYLRRFDEEEGVSFVKNDAFNCCTVRVSKNLEDYVESCKDKGLTPLSRYEENELNFDEIF